MRVAGINDHVHPTSLRRDRPTAWVVSPHLLVAQAVAAALRAMGASVDFHAWDTLGRDVVARSGPAGTRHVVAIVDGYVDEDVIDQVGALTTLGDVRVAVVTTDLAPAPWSRLLADERIEVVTMATSVADLAASIERFTAGQPVMSIEERVRLRMEWERGLDRRRVVQALLDKLSPQQLRVLRLLATGRRVHEVARFLGVADGTVRSHVKALRNRIGAGNQLEAVAMLRQVEDGAPSLEMVPRPRTPRARTGDPAERR